MAFPITTGTSLFSQSSLLFTLPLKPQFYSSKNLIQSSHRATGSAYTTSSWLSNRSSRLHRLNCRHREALKRGLSSVCFYKTNNSSNGKGSELRWPILQRWDVPWEWYTVSLTSLACGLSFVLTGLIASAALPYLGVQIGELSLDEKAQILFFDQALLYLGFSNGDPSSIPISATLVATDTRFKAGPRTLEVSGLKHVSYPSLMAMGICRQGSLSGGEPGREIPSAVRDWRDPFSLQKGWLLWAVIGLIGALVTISLTGVAMSFLNGEAPQRETDALVRLLPLIGSSGVSTAYLVGITGVLAPVLEENVFRGFLMVALTKWVPTPISIIISAAVFSAAHLTPGEFPQLFILGAALGLSYAQTRNLLTPITIHAFWNSGVILLLTFLQIQGYDIKELLQVS
ncbi:putative Type II CAAX prenyl endopeptidase Rce1 [Helianthus annuus]|nr:putative Type II CAAX prenyl endopeptidase Rce1 [Helianthus annuus]